MTSSPYPLIEREILGLKVFIPDPKEIQRHYENAREDNEALPFPFWSRIWPSAIALSIFIEQHQVYVKDRVVVELGAGLSIPSFIASRYAKSVLATDFAEDAIEFTKLNLGKLGIQNLSAELLDWNEWPAELIADTVLMSDVNYSPSEFEQLNKIIDQLLSKGATIILSTPDRLMSKSFIDYVMPYIALRETKIIDETEILVIVLKK